jgi:hypothetical protein
MANRLSRFFPVLALTGVLTGCGVATWEPRIMPEGNPVPLREETPYLKAHLHSGELFIFSNWRVPSEDDPSLDGFAIGYSVDRVPQSEGEISLPLDSIALLEANRKETVSRFAFSGLTVYTVASTLVTVACVTDPKACFGSCPTFYLEDGPSEELVAEGFSSSVARVFEASDVDALPQRAGGGEDYAILMRNEAPETHAVRSLHLLAAAASPGRVVYATSLGRFREGSVVGEPTLCAVLDSARPSDCTRAVRDSDEIEYFSSADSLDLAAREWIEVELPPVPEGLEPGLLIRGRASLLSTYLFYQTLAYVGEDAGTFLASLERGDRQLARRVMGLPDALGPVEVHMERDGEWVEVGRFGEAGPIAPDAQVVVLPSSSRGPLKVRLRLAKGAWRLDQIGSVGLGKEVEPLVLSPASVEVVSSELAPEVALNRLLDPDRHLVTQQGDEFRIHFRLPPGTADWSLFLDSRGYYYEWMRGEWLGERNPAMAALILSDPQTALRMLAPAFKAREGAMEETFWSSRFRRNQR